MLDTSMLDWEDRITSGRSIIPPPLFPDEAAAALEVFKQLRIVDAAGSPTMGEACAPWVFDFVGAVFGAYDIDTGKRMISEFMLLIPKKNSKSTIAAGIMITALIRNWRKSAEMIIISPTVEIALNSYAPCRDMVKADPELSDLFQVQDHLKCITHRGNGSTLKVVAADQHSLGGKKAAWVLCDELHLLGKVHNASGMLLEATGGLAARPEGAILYLTTQSDDCPAGVFRDKLNYARGVRDGRVKDPGFLSVIYEFPEQMIKAGDHRDPKNFHMVNPNMGMSISEDFLRREFRKAGDGGEESIRQFLSKFLNVEIGLNLRSDRWLGADYWLQNTDKNITLESLIETCEVVEIGLDGGGLYDLLGMAVVGRDAETKKWKAWGRGWAHPSVLTQSKQFAPLFRDFEKQGDLIIVDKIGDDVISVAQICKRVYDSGKLDQIGVDPHGLGGILQALEEYEIPDDKIIGISQGWKLQGAIKTSERYLAEGRIAHADQPIMSWCAGNAKITPKENAIMITKQASGLGKIDLLMAFFNAVQLLSLNPASEGKSFWES